MASVTKSPTKQAPRVRKQPATSPRLSVAGGSGLHGGQAGVCCSFRVVCKDVEGVKRTLGGDFILATLSYDNGLPSIDAHVVDGTDGSYTASYTPFHCSASCKLTVLINGTHVEGSPYTAQVMPGEMEARLSEINGRGLYDGLAGHPCQFTIQTKDSFGNRGASSGEKFVVKVRHAPSPAPAHPQPWPGHQQRRCHRATTAQPQRNNGETHGAATA